MSETSGGREFRVSVGERLPKLLQSMVLSHDHDRTLREIWACEPIGLPLAVKVVDVISWVWPQGCVRGREVYVEITENNRAGGGRMFGRAGRRGGS